MYEIFDSYKLVLSQLKDILQEDICVALTDRTKVIKNYDADSFKIPSNEGDIIKEGEPIWETIHKNKVTVGTVSKEYYGFPFKAVTYPIRNNEGQTIGCVAIAKNLTEHLKFQESTGSLFAALEQTSASIQELTQGSEKLFSMMNNIVQSVKQSEKSITENAEIIKLIHNIGSQSNLLGLNAAIEASRAGESGKGFSVVATEMRKLANISKESAEKVSKDLLEIQKSMEAILKIVSKAADISEIQAITTKEISSAIEEITSSSEKIVNNIKQL